MAKSKAADSSNGNLHAAKKNKNDEFYTRLEDIEKELFNYRHLFKGKKILCNCDDPKWSNFWRYFHLRFQELELEKLVATHYDPNAAESYALVYYGGNDLNINDGTKVMIAGDGTYCPGDFRSEACVELLKDADIVVTNPPFSLFREYIAQLMEYEKKFVVIGNQNAITYKEFFPLIKNNKVWEGYYSVKEFLQPDGTIKKFGNILWFTNLDIAKRHERFFAPEIWHPRYEDDPSAYPKYDNYDAIEVGKCADIPEDYYGVMGVPITFLDKYNPEEFEIIDNSTMSGKSANYWTFIDGKPRYARIYIRRRHKGVK